MSIALMNPKATIHRSSAALIFPFCCCPTSPSTNASNRGLHLAKFQLFLCSCTASFRKNSLPSYKLLKKTVSVQQREGRLDSTRPHSHSYFACACRPNQKYANKIKNKRKEERAAPDGRGENFIASIAELLAAFLSLTDTHPKIVGKILNGQKEFLFASKRIFQGNIS